MLNDSAQSERLVFTTTAVTERKALPTKVTKIRTNMAAIAANHERPLPTSTVDTMCLQAFQLSLPFFYRVAKKTTPFWESFWEIVKTKSFLVHALFGHFGALSRTLTGFETRVGLVDDVKGAFTLADLTVSVAAFGGGEGRKNFHRTRS